MTDEIQDDYEEFEEGPSKSQIKREMKALQEIGAKLLTLNADQIKQLPLSDEMLAAIDESRRIRSHEAQRRHLQYIGKVMRREDTEAISEKIALFDTTSDAYNRQFHMLEHWRDRLIAEGDSALNALIEEKPETDRQMMRQLIRTAQKELKNEKPPAAARKIFRALREIFGL
ncbi:MAG: ribosome biogenesis factor YjgA [Oceanospirillum sp.]|nr:ribosome biogenesis factor YjgA [Oceanospirillum sp.]MDX1397783.1 ribosome biogenesis factor YjgA [Oceanospirillum sp.]